MDGKNSWIDGIHKILNFPFFYNCAQFIFAPGADRNLRTLLQALKAELPRPGVLLDVGCGPSSWLWKIGWQPVGLDISYPYSAAFLGQGRMALTGSCVALPFCDQSFDGIWNIGVLHHLEDAAARAAVSEMTRVCRPDGYVVIMDAVVPEPAWQRPVASLVRKMDRGKFMRTQKQLESLLPKSFNLSIRRHTFAYTGLEMLTCICRCTIKEDA